MKLFCRHSGSGQPVVILHGLFGISDNWVTFARRISDAYSVFVPDLRNHGQSPHSKIFDFPSLTDDLLELIEENNLKDIFLIGHSMGGKTAMLFSLLHPQLVKKLVVVDIGLKKSRPDRDHQKLLNAMMAVDFTEARSRSDVDKQLAATVPDQKVRQFLLKNVYWRDRHALDWRLNLASVNENLPAIFESISQPGAFSGPALFVRGALSDYLSDQEFEEIKLKFPAAELATIAGASHWVHADAPDAFHDAVMQFLTR